MIGNARERIAPAQFVPCRNNKVFDAGMSEFC
jgi:hypothetical protein